MSKRRLVIGISGSSGVVLGIRLLQALRPGPNRQDWRGGEVETHLVLTPAARLTIEQETSWKPADVQALADVTYSDRDIGAAIASGSFVTEGMVVIPCSIKSLSAIANSYAADLLSRAADVTLKEGRPLLLVVRETPLHRGHLRLMDRAAAAGAIIFPPVPAFYTHPQTLDEVVDNLVGRVLLRLGIENDLFQPWQGLSTRLTRGADASAASEAAPLPASVPQPAPSSSHDQAPLLHGPVSSADLLAELLALPVMTLATSGASGQPHAAAVYFAADSAERLYFFSETASQHARDLEANPHNSQAAVTIQPLVSGYREIRGLQLRGRVRLVPPGPEWDAAFALYQAKFPFVNELKEEVAQNTLYVFTPAWMRLLDNRVSFGYKEEKDLP